jgi:hypothetical protein
MINNKHYTKPNDVAEQFNHHFINVGPNLASTIDSIQTMIVTHLSI